MNKLCCVYYARLDICQNLPGLAFAISAISAGRYARNNSAPYTTWPPFRILIGIPTTPERRAEKIAVTRTPPPDARALPSRMQEYSLQTGREVCNRFRSLACLQGVPPAGLSVSWGSDERGQGTGRQSRASSAFMMSCKECDHAVQRFRCRRIVFPSNSPGTDKEPAACEKSLLYERR